MNIVDQYLKKPPTPSGGGGADEHSSTVMERPVIMVSFVLADGTQAAYPYATLLRVIVAPERGIVLSFTADEVIVEGSSLDPLYRRLTQHRVSKVEITTDERRIGVTDKDTPIVTGISIAENPSESTGHS